MIGPPPFHAHCHHPAHAQLLQPCTPALQSVINYHCKNSPSKPLHIGIVLAKVGTAHAPCIPRHRCAGSP